MKEETKNVGEIPVNPASERYWPNFEGLSNTELMEIQAIC